MRSRAFRIGALVRTLWGGHSARGVLQRRRISEISEILDASSPEVVLVQVSSYRRHPNILILCVCASPPQGRRAHREIL
eukprot:2020392-Pyramimonas_sp.AAC.1